MSDSHEQALKALEEMQGRADANVPGLWSLAIRTDNPKLIAALKGVLELHGHEREEGLPENWCRVCSAETWPCPTVRAIAEALK